MSSVTDKYITLACSVIHTDYRFTWFECSVQPHDQGLVCSWQVNIEFNSLWPSDAIWLRRSSSTLVHAMACCLTAPSHYLNQCWWIIRGVLWLSPETNFTRSAHEFKSITHVRRLYFLNYNTWFSYTHGRYCLEIKQRRRNNICIHLVNAATTFLVHQGHRLHIPCSWFGLALSCCVHINSLAPGRLQFDLR